MIKSLKQRKGAKQCSFTECIIGSGYLSSKDFSFRLTTVRLWKVFGMFDEIAQETKICSAGKRSTKRRITNLSIELVAFNRHRCILRKLFFLAVEDLCVYCSAILHETMVVLAFGGCAPWDVSWGGATMPSVMLA